MRGIPEAPNSRLIEPSSSARKNSLLLLMLAKLLASSGRPVNTQATTRWFSSKDALARASSLISVIARGLSGEPRKLNTTQRPALTCRSKAPPLSIGALNHGTDRPESCRHRLLND